MPLMDRIYCKSFLGMHYSEKASFIDKVRAIRLTEIAAAKNNAKRVTKSAMKNIAGAKGKRKKKMIKDPTLTAKKALAKLSPEQIAMIAKQFKGN